MPSLSQSPSTVSVEEAIQTLVAQATPSPTGLSPLPTAIQESYPTLPPAPALTTATSAGSPVLPTRTAEPGNSEMVFVYTTQPGDTLNAVAGRFGVDPDQITSSQGIPTQSLLPIGMPLTIPNVLGDLPYYSPLLPDCELIYSPAAVDFHVAGYAGGAGGYLIEYGEMVDDVWLSGVDIVQRVAEENSVNPRLLLALLEYRSGWVFGQPANTEQVYHPLGLYIPGYRGLYDELLIASTQLNLAYYGWREGTLTEIKFRESGKARLSPGLNAGTIAIQHLFAKLYKVDAWDAALYGPNSFPLRYQQMFGDPWARADAAGPLFPDGLSQPILELPFSPGESWSYTGGPHYSWNTTTPRGAIDLAPVTGEAACVVSRAWVTASAPGVVTRSGQNVLALDLDGDGYEQTGWVLVYMHIAVEGAVPAGTWVDLDAPLGHPSCERGRSTGTHVHIARKYNGEWIAADGALPFVMGGWQVKAEERLYQGLLVKGDQVIVANPGGPRTSIVTR